MTRRTWSARAGACVITAFALMVAACGGGSDGGSKGAAGTTLPSKACPGEPLKFTSIIALSRAF